MLVGLVSSDQGVSSSVPDIGRHSSMNTHYPPITLGPALACFSLTATATPILSQLAGARHCTSRRVVTQEESGTGVSGAGQGLQGPLSTVTGSALMAPAPRGKLRAQRRPHRRAGELILKLIVQRLPQTVVALLFQTRAVSLKKSKCSQIS